MKKKLLLSLTCAVMAFSFLPSNVLAAPANPEISQNAEVRKDDIQYQYKVINNALYKRLFNYSKGIPLSDWVIVK